VTSQRSLSYQGHYAGAVSRLLSFAVDLAVSAGAFSLGLAAISYGAQIITGNLVSWNRSSAVVIAIFAVWELVYFGCSWATSGRTPGMALFGIRVVRGDGTALDPRHAAIRTIAFPFSFLFCCLGLFGIVLGRENRALHDVLADTVVIYEWGTRTHRARGESPNPPALPGPPSTAPEAGA
jgi:uncharacterized RDD family membrane protein YckC